MAKEDAGGEDRLLENLSFQEFWYDINMTDSGKNKDKNQRIKRKLKSLSSVVIIRSLFFKNTLDENQTRHYQEELHKRINLPLMALTLGGFLLGTRISPLHRSHGVRWQSYLILCGVIGLVLLQAFLVNQAVALGVFALIASYLLPILIGYLSIFAKRKDLGDEINHPLFWIEDFFRHYDCLAFYRGHGQHFKLFGNFVSSLKKRG